MSTLQIIVLAIVQGLTEFLPVSSSAHLVLTSRLLGWADQGLAMDVAVHLGTLLAVFTHFRRDLRRMVQATLRPTPETAHRRRLLLYVALATIPVLLVGYLAYDLVSEHLRDIRVIAGTTLVFGLLLWWADARFAAVRPIERLNLRDALLVGLAQALALVPGVSRSGVTMTVARMLGFGARDSARFSFLLAIPVIGIAGAYNLLKLLLSEGGTPGWDFALAVVFAAVAGWLCIAAFLALLERVGLFPFIIYRLLLGGVLLFIALNAP